MWNYDDRIDVTPAGRAHVAAASKPRPVRRATRTEPRLLRCHGCKEPVCPADPGDKADAYVMCDGCAEDMQRAEARPARRPVPLVSIGEYAV